MPASPRPSTPSSKAGRFALRVALAGILTLAGLWSWGHAASADKLDLIEATKRGDLAAVETLLASGADPDAHDQVNNTALIFAARDGRLSIARLLIERGATVDWIDGEGVTPLILAAFKGHLGLVKLLLDHKARRDLRDQWGRRALDYALRRGPNDPIARLLKAPP